MGQERGHKFEVRKFLYQDTIRKEVERERDEQEVTWDRHPRHVAQEKDAENKRAMNFPQKVGFNATEP